MDDSLQSGGGIENIAVKLRAAPGGNGRTFKSACIMVLKVLSHYLWDWLT
jgi:hypothetical protein